VAWLAWARASAPSGLAQVGLVRALRRKKPVRDEPKVGSDASAGWVAHLGVAEPLALNISPGKTIGKVSCR
jgi:hypothetical protein